MSSQIELRATVPSELADRLEAYFFETETPYWGVMQRERDDPFEVFGFFPDAPTAEAELASLRAEFTELPPHFAQSEINDADWQNAYKAFVKPWQDRSLHWVPLWEQENIEVPQGHAVVYLDAGMAFGTGAHETTRLCARRLLDYREAHPERIESTRLIDAGCGSGILALSAAGLGFRQIYAFDFDPEAIRVCRENVDYNPQVTTAVDFAVADLVEGLKDREADLMLANIQTDVLLPHADNIISSVAAGGSLALSGILTKELEEVSTHYQERIAALGLGPVSVDSRSDGEWADLLIQRA